MNPVARLLCIFDRHQPDRHAVNHDGQYYVGYCVTCDQRIIRRKHRSWRADPRRS